MAEPLSTTLHVEYTETKALGKKRSWKEHHFELLDGLLRFFYDPMSSHLKHDLELRGGKIGPTKTERGAQSKGCVFRLDLPPQHNDRAPAKLVLQAKTRSARASWLLALQSAGMTLHASFQDELSAMGLEEGMDLPKRVQFATTDNSSLASGGRSCGSTSHAGEMSASRGGVSEEEARETRARALHREQLSVDVQTSSRDVSISSMRIFNSSDGQRGAAAAARGAAADLATSRKVAEAVGGGDPSTIAAVAAIAAADVAAAGVATANDANDAACVASSKSPPPAALDECGDSLDQRLRLPTVVDLRRLLLTRPANGVDLLIRWRALLGS